MYVDEDSWQIAWSIITTVAANSGVLPKAMRSSFNHQVPGYTLEALYDWWPVVIWPWA